MIIVGPPTRSPARIAIMYQYRTVQHQVSANLLASVNPNDLPLMRGDATALAVAIQGVFNPLHIIDRWRILTHEGQVLYEESFASVYVGTHGSDPGMRDYYSPTIKLLGKGTPSGVQGGTGRTSLLLFTGDSYAINPGDKVLTSPDTALLALITALDGNGDLWADFYGQQARYTGRTMVQFNAHEQKRSGT